jgi:hypothetical protein
MDTPAALTMKIHTLALWIGLALSIAACSEDKHLFYSSIGRPTHIELYDTVADRVIWEKHIPIEHTLELDLDREGEPEEWKKVEDKPATNMTWKLYKDLDEDPIASEEVDLSGSRVMIRVSYPDAH